jgi:hypothetical protein
VEVQQPMVSLPPHHAHSTAWSPSKILGCQGQLSGAEGCLGVPDWSFSVPMGLPLQSLLLLICSECPLCDLMAAKSLQPGCHGILLRRFQGS